MINKYLQKDFDRSLSLFNQMNSHEDVANFLEVSVSYLLFLAYKDKKAHYKEFEIPKKNGGVRKIKKPIKSIDLIQNKMLPFFQEKYKIKRPVHGFVKGKSTLTGASQHIKKKFILNIDLQDFYNTIHFGRIRGLLMARPFNMGEQAATLVAHLCCHDGTLPQGACTSPVLSNLIMAQLDSKLTAFAYSTHCTYTRYADDITFSSTKNFSEKIVVYQDELNSSKNRKIELGDTLKNIIHSCDFKINDNKTRIEPKSLRQEVTGITVNDFPNVKRTYIRQIRAMLHCWEKNGIEYASNKHLLSKRRTFEVKNKEEFFKNVIIGKLAYLKMIRGTNDIILRKLCLKAIQMMEHEKLPKFIERIKMQYEEFQVFICHASEDKDKIARPLYDELINLGIKTFLDEKYIEWGDSLTEKINHALGQSKYVVAVLSDNSIEKKWPLKEINSTLAREIAGNKIILPIIAGNEKLIFQKLPLLQDKLYKSWNHNAQEVAKNIQSMLNGQQVLQDSASESKRRFSGLKLVFSNWIKNLLSKVLKS